MKRNPEDAKRLQQLGGLGAILVGLMSLAIMIQIATAPPPAGEIKDAEVYLRWLLDNKHVYYLTVVAIIISALAFVWVMALAERLETRSPLWGALSRPWGYAAYMLAMLESAWTGMPHLLAANGTWDVAAIMQARPAYTAVNSGIDTVVTCLMGVWLLSAAMGARRGALSRPLFYVLWAWVLCLLLLFTGAKVLAMENAFMTGVLGAAAILRVVFPLYCGLEMWYRPAVHASAADQAA